MENLSDNFGSKFPRKPLINSNGYPYLPARVVPVNYDMTKPWFIIYRIWDTAKEKLVRRRVLNGMMADIHNREKRIEFAQEVVQEINHELKTGGYQHSAAKEKEVEEFNFRNYSLLDALTYVADHKKNIENRSPDPFVKIQTVVLEYLTHANLRPSFPLVKVDKTFVNKFMIYVKEVRGVANNTRNNYLGNIHTAFETLRKLDDKLWPSKNPAYGISKLAHKVSKNRAFTMDQLREFEKIIQPQDPQLFLFVQMIFYTLARPRKEIRYMKIKHLEFDFNRIVIPGANAKTQERYTGMNERLRTIIKDAGILDYPKDYYLFSVDGKPGPVPCGKNYFYKQFVPYLEKLGMKGSNYTLYSFNHSGAIQLYLATKDPYLVQQQKGHTTLSQTQKYLRDLGLFVNFKELDKWNGF